MTQLEEKKMLAEFMGWEDEIEKLHYKSIEWFALFQKMKFEDYNSLMCCVDFIERLETNFHITNNEALIIYKDECIVGIQDVETKLSAIYRACVEFVKWWNIQNKKREVK